MAIVLPGCSGGRRPAPVGSEGQFHDAGLLDELIVQVGSVTLGTGKQLFPRRLTTPPLTLVSVRQVGTGFAELRYQVPTKSRAHTA